jgi:hypothetical protein
MFKDTLIVSCIVNQNLINKKLYYNQNLIDKKLDYSHNYKAITVQM